MKEIRLLTLLSLLQIIFTSERANSQSPDWLWAKSIGSEGWDVAASIALDHSGSIYTTGYFQDTVDFDPGPGVYNMISTFSSIFISKLDNAGNFIWAKSMGGSNEAFSFTIVIDGSGSIYITGYFTGTVDFNPDPAINYNITSAGLEDAFIAKLDSAGNFVWAKTMSGQNDQRSYSLAIDDSANVFSTGFFTDTTDFDPDTGVFNVISNGYLDCYISKWDSSGNFMWVKSFGDTLGDQGYFITLDTFGNIYTCGYFSDTVDFDPGPGTYNLISSPWTNTFVCKLDNDGNFKMAAAFNVTLSPFDHSLAVDDSGNIYFTGDFYATADLDPDSNGVFNLTAAGYYDIFLSKYDSLGHFLWAKGMGGTMDDFGSYTALDHSGNIYITGTIIGAVDMDPDTGVSILTTNGGDKDNFISKFSPFGNLIWTKAIGGTNSSGTCVFTFDQVNNIYLAGKYNHSPFNIGPYTFINTDTTFYTCNIFIAKLDTQLVTENMEVQTHRSEILIYPNPAFNNFTIFIKDNFQPAVVTIFDMTGKLICETPLNNSETAELNIELSPGVYLVKIISDSYIETKKLIIK